MAERIEDLISPEALDSFDALNAKIAIGVIAIEKLLQEAAKLNKEFGGKNTFKGVKEGVDGLNESEKKLKDTQTELEKQQKKLDALYTEEAKKLTELKLKQQERNAELKREAIINSNAEGAIKRQVALLQQLQTQYDKLSPAQRNTDGGKVLLKQIEQLDAEVKQLEGSTGRFQRNVGNYSSAVKVLEKALNDVNRKLDQNQKESNLSSDAVENLKKEQGLLVAFLERQTAAFSSASQEIKENTKQLFALEQAGLQATETYINLKSATAELVNASSSLNTAIKNSIPDAAIFQGATDALRGLVALYGLGQSAAAIFGGENQALQETMVKLQAAETALQSIEALYNLTKKENAAMQAISIGLVKLETATQSKNIIVKYTAIAAQKALNAVMALGTGPLIGITLALAALVLLLSSFSTSTKEATKSLEQMNAEMDLQLGLLDKYNDATSAASDMNIAKLQANFATEKQIRQEQIKLIRDQLRETAIFLTENQKNYDQAQGRLREIAERTKRRGQTSLSDDEKEEIEKLEEIRDKFQGAQKRRDDLETQREVALSNDVRQSTLERVKARQTEIDVTIQSIQLLADAYNKQSEDETKSYSVRIAAAEKFFSEQRRIANLQAQQALLTPGQSPEEIRKINANRLTAIKQNNQQEQAVLKQLRQEEMERRRAALLEIFKIETEDAAKIQDAIADNEKKGYSERLDAAYAAYEKRRDIVIAENQMLLSSTKLTAEERKAIEVRYASEINAVTAEYLAKQNELLIANTERFNSELDKARQARLDSVGAGSSKQLAEINRLFADGLISLKDYTQKRANIERQANIDTLRAEVDIATQKLLATKEGTAERIAAEKEYYEAQDKLGQALIDREIERAQLRTEINKMALEGAAEVFQQILLARYDREKNAIEEQIEALEKKKQKDIEVANQSITNEQERAARITTIEARAQAQREALERRQKQIDYERARTERALTIGKIIAETALGVMHQYTSGDPYTANLRAIAVGVAGAVNLAKVLATPLPKFAQGTLNAPGGPSVVGDAYRSEYVVTPSGEIIKTPSVPTVMNVPKHSIVYPDERSMLEQRVGTHSTKTLVNHDQYMVDKLGRKLDRLNRTVSSKKENHYHSSLTDGIFRLIKSRKGWIGYIDENTQSK